MQQFNFFDSKKKLKQLWLLEELYKNPNLTQKVLADKVGITKGMVNRYLKEFKKNDLLATNSNNELTKSGTSLLLKLRGKYKNELKKMSDFISEESRKYQDDDISKIKIAAIKSLGTMLPYLAEKLKIVSNYPLEFEIDYYQSGQHLMENFLNRKYDFGLLGSVPAFLWQASGVAINIVGKINNGGHAIVGRNTIDSVIDLDEKTVLVPIVNESVSDNLLKKLSNQKNIKPKRIDFSDLEMKWDQLLTTGVDDKVDAILLWEPYVSYILKKNDDMKVIYDFSYYNQNYSANVLISNNKRKNSDIKTDIIEEIFNDTVHNIKVNKGKVIEYLSQFFEMEKSIMDLALQRVKFKYIKDWEEKVK